MAHGLASAPCAATRLALVRVYQRCLSDAVKALGQRAHSEHTPTGRRCGASSSSNSSSSNSGASSDGNLSVHSISDEGSEGSCSDECFGESASSKSSDDECEASHDVADQSSAPAFHSGCTHHHSRRHAGQRHKRPAAPFLSPCLSLNGAGVSAYIALVRSVIGSKQVGLLIVVVVLFVVVVVTFSWFY